MKGEAYITVHTHRMSSQKKKKRGAAPLDICIQIQIFFFLFLFSSVAAKSYVVIFSSSLPFLLQFSRWGFFWPSCSSFQGYKRLRLWKWRFLASLCSRQAHRDSRDKTTLIQRYKKGHKIFKIQSSSKIPLPSIWQADFVMWGLSYFWLKII